MLSRAHRAISSGRFSAALLPEIALGLEWAGDLEVVSLELGAPDRTIRVLGSTSTEVAAQLPRAVPKRRAEFAAGRHAAALALARYGCEEPVARNADGSPAWPAGFIGSISHGAGLAVAVVARSDGYRSVGVDVERLISNGECAAIADRILSPEDFDVLNRALPEAPRRDLLSLGFSVKESVYKCLNPLAAEFIEFEDACVIRVLPESAVSGRIWLSLSKSFSGDLGPGIEVPGCYAFQADHVETLVWLGRGHR